MGGPESGRQDCADCPDLAANSAYRIDDQWSIGAGLTANYGYFKLEREPVGGGGTNSQDDGDWDFGARLGVLFEPSKNTRFGLTWVSETEYEFEVDGSVTIDPPPLGGPTFSVTIPFAAGIIAPQQVMGSVYHRLNDDWAVMGNLGWQEWSRFADSTVNAGDTGGTIGLRLQDTWHAAVGAQYTLNAQTRLNAGVAFDTSIYEDQNQTSFALPNGDTWRIGAGVQHTLSPKSELGVAFEYVLSEDSSSPSALVSGSYDNPQIFFMSAHYTYRF